jgi:hypothetical protein
MTPVQIVNVAKSKTDSRRKGDDFLTVAAKHSAIPGSLLA